MLEEHLLLRNCSGQMWNNSPAQKYLESLPIASPDTSSVMDTRYLLPREYIFTFGFENGITNPVIYFSCKLCQLLIKIHELKNHMVTKHPNLETSVAPTLIQTTSPPQLCGKSKKNSHKSKKKVVPPPNVPPPPLFSNIEVLNPVNTVPTIENLLPPILQPVETVKENSTYAMEVDSVPNLIPPPSLPTQVTTSPRIIRLPAVSILKPKKERLEIHKHKKSKKKRNDFNPDKHCGVLDDTNQPCMKAITCTNHSIIERRAVRGRSASIDSLISIYKSSKPKPKHQQSSPVLTREAKIGLKIIEYLYEKNPYTTLKMAEGSTSASVLDGYSSTSHNGNKAHKRENSVLQSIKITSSSNSGNVQSTIFLSNENTDKQMVSPKANASNGKLGKPRIGQGGGSLQLSTPPPGLYGMHPKPMTMLTGSLRRIGGNIVVQNSSRLDSQRMDLQAVINQHKQLKLSASNKAVLQLNSNNSKQSILKNNLKNNLKTGSFKQTPVDKTNDLKHVICACSYIKQLL